MAFVGVSMFKKVEQNRVFHGVMLQLEEAILDGRFQPGEKLPPERELKETFQVGRGAVREALRVLEQKGLLEIRLGAQGGAIVTKPSGKPILESLSLLLKRKEIPFADIQEFRSTVEGRIAFLAAKRCTPNDISRLQGILVRCQEHLEKEYDWDAFLLEDGRFHQELSNIARSQLFSLIADALHQNIHNYYDSRLEKKKTILEENLRDLHDIFQAIKNGDSQQARQCMRSHIVRFDAYMTQEQGEIL
jgi:GntR family transcriptional regulator, transcriptional repressor for pyruvate dehydrogenase complex